MPASEDDARERLSEIQRKRMIDAMVEISSRQGVGSATVARVVARSGVSRRTFYELFDDREDCFIAAFDQAVERIAAVVLPAYQAPVKWRERMRGGLSALLEYIDREPSVGRLVVVVTLEAGPQALERRRRVLARLVVAVEQGREQGKRGKDTSALTGEGIVGGVLSLVHARLVGDGHDPLAELVNPLMAMIVLPYLGAPAARRELHEPAFTAGDGGRPAARDPLCDMDMRLTYRTVRVLLAVGADPSASNRQVADKAGIRDQGQISKLLGRLQQLGLVHNAGHAHAKGEPNAWMLTEKGVELQGAFLPDGAGRPAVTDIAG